MGSEELGAGWRWGTAACSSAGWPWALQLAAVQLGARGLASDLPRAASLAEERTAAGAINYVQADCHKAIGLKRKPLKRANIPTALSHHA